MSATLTLAAKAIAVKVLVRAAKWFHFGWCHRKAEQWRAELKARDER